MKQPIATTGALRVARRSVPLQARSSPLAATLQRKCACGNQASSGDSCGECQRNRLQRRATNSTGTDPIPASVHQSLQSPGRRLDDATRTFFEDRFDHDFSRVRVHADDTAAVSAAAVSARAYTVGEHVVFGAGQYTPSVETGRRLLAHELAHVVQSGRGGLQAAPLAIDTGPADPLELEAERAAQDVMSGRAPNIRRHGPGGRLRRLGIIDEPAGGCGTCKDPTLVGTDVHALVQAGFPPTYQNEVPFQLPASPSGARLDLLHVTLSEKDPPSTIEIGEIKPNNINGVKEGASDLIFYMTALRALFRPPMWEVEPMTLPPPIIPTPYHDGISPACPSQVISVIGSDGLYLYGCAPPRSTVPKSCCLPVPPPLPHKKDVKEDDKKKVDEDDKEKDKEKDKDKPPVGPPVPVPVFDIALLLAALGAGAYMLSKLSGPARARVLAPLIVIATAVLIANGAEASVGLEGDDALEALIKLSEAKGQTIPDDVKEAMRKDPALKQALTKAAKTGNFDEVQRQTGERLARVVAEHRGEFSDEELEMLLKATEGAKGSIPGGDVTVEDLKRQIEAKKKSASAGAGGDGTKSGVGKGDGAADGDAQPASPSPDVQGPPPPPLPAPAQRLQDALVQRGGKGPKISKAELQELRETLRSQTPPLTDAEVDALLAKVVSAEGKTAAELINSVREGIAQLRNPKPTETNKPKPGSDGASGDGSGKPENQQPPQGGGSFPAPLESDEKKQPKPSAKDKADGEAYAQALANNKARFEFLSEGQAVMLSDKKKVIKVGTPISGFLVCRNHGSLCMGTIIVTPKQKVSDSEWIMTLRGGSKMYGETGGLCGVTQNTDVSIK